MHAKEYEPELVGILGSAAVLNQLILLLLRIIAKPNSYERDSSVFHSDLAMSI